jgi:ring-1,2-phenylacetyl-CoA epoxidase subunit PaaD
MKIIEDDIIAAFRTNGYANIFVNTVYSPAWTTNWLSDSTKEKLKAYGIAPPGKSTNEAIILLPTIKETVACPFCESNETELRSEFGSTACKSIHYCNNCKQPFDHLKEI